MLPRSWALLLVASFAGFAEAGLLDGRPPRIESGEPLIIVYRMGAIYFEPGRVDTVITCVNEDRTAAQIALEVFDPSDAAAGAVAWRRVPAGGEAVFTTSSAAGPEGRTVVPSLGALSHGKARVSATTTRLRCAGYWRARSADGTTKDSPLQLVKRVAAGAKP